MFAAAILAVQLAAAADPAPDRYAKPNLLIEPGAIFEPARDGRVRVLDLRGDQKYADGHVPRAVAAPLGKWSKAVNDGTADAKFWRRELSVIGVRPDVPVVVYSDDVKDAARGWWLLKLAGVPDVRVMNGGWDAYLLAGGRVVKEADLADADPVDWKPADRLATKADTLAATQGKPAGVQIVDARTGDEYRGEQKTAKKAGHIPGAVSAEWTEFVDTNTQRFKSPAEIAAVLAERKIDLGKPAVTYCQAGGRSAVAAFALELMGADGVRNYYRGWSEWGNEPDTPVTGPPADKEKKKD